MTMRKSERERAARVADKYITADGGTPSEGAPVTPSLEEIARLARLPLIDYDLQRKGAAEQIGCRVSALDRAVDDYRRDHPAEMGTALAAPDRWPDPVDGRELLDQIAAAMSRFLILPPHAAEAAALWVVHAHALDAFYFSPILLLTSPEKRCGKTTALQVLEALTPKSMLIANILSASLFRTIESMCPTLLIDEGDTFLDKSADLRGIINAGHSRAACVIRTVGGEPRAFSVWCPKVIAGIGRRAGTIEDRSIILPLRRKLRTEAAERFRQDRTEEFAGLRRQAARWAADYMDALRAADPDTPPELGDRAADNWRGLIGIADLAGGDWPDNARQAAVALSGWEADDPFDSPGAQLLADTRRVFVEQGASLFTPRDLVNAIGRLEEAALGRGRQLTTKALAGLLHPFGIKSQKPARMHGRKPARHYFRGDFEDAWARYLPQEPVTSVTSVTTKKINGLTESPIDSVTDENGENVFKINGVTVVVDGVIALGNNDIGDTACEA